MKAVDSLNKKLNSLNEQVDQYSEKIKKIRHNQLDIIDKYLKDNSKNECVKRYEKVSKNISMYRKGLHEINREMLKFYKLAFSGIIAGRVRTDIKLPNNFMRYGYDDKIWINSKGLAFKLLRIHQWQPNYIDHTRCFDSESVFDMIRGNPELVDYIKRKDKKEIFMLFHTYLKNMKSIYLYDKMWRENIEIPESIENYDNDISKKKLTLNFRAATKIQVSVPFASSGVPRVRFLTGNNYNVSQIFLSDLEIKKSTNYERDIYALSQLKEEVIIDLEKHATTLKDAYDHNLKLLGKFNTDIAPYIMHKMI